MQPYELLDAARGERNMVSLVTVSQRSFAPPPESAFGLNLWLFPQRRRTAEHPGGDALLLLPTTESLPPVYSFSFPPLPARPAG